MTAWRLILDGAGEGAWNMAVDRSILEAHERGEAPPTLRLYGWERPTVTLGRFQDASEVDVAACQEMGVGVCRRPTGGRGVLHADEVTYSIIAGVHDGLPRGVRASYGVLCGALSRAYAELGVQASLTARTRGDHSTAACYLLTTGADLSVDSAKLTGSAQVWSRDSVLQHGSFVMARDIALEARVFKLTPEATVALDLHTITISDALDRNVSSQEVEVAIRDGLADHLGVMFTEGALSLAELDRAQCTVEQYHVSL